jgi:hypothetical protein
MGRLCPLQVSACTISDTSELSSGNLKERHHLGALGADMRRENVRGTVPFRIQSTRFANGGNLLAVQAKSSTSRTVSCMESGISSVYHAVTKKKQHSSSDERTNFSYHISVKRANLSLADHNSRGV